MTRSQRTLVIWKSKEYMPGNGDNTCFTLGNVKYHYAMRTSSDLHREVLDDRKIFVMIFGDIMVCVKCPLMLIASEDLSRCMSVYIRTRRVTHLRDDSILGCVIHK